MIPLEDLFPLLERPCIAGFNTSHHQLEYPSSIAAA
jgi:hypothetical protein